MVVLKKLIGLRGCSKIKGKKGRRQFCYLAGAGSCSNLVVRGKCVPGQSLQSCLTLFHHMDCSPPGSSVHGVFLAKILEWVAISLGFLVAQSIKNLPAV